MDTVISLVPPLPRLPHCKISEPHSLTFPASGEVAMAGLWQGRDWGDTHVCDASDSSMSGTQWTLRTPVMSEYGNEASKERRAG